MAGLGCGADSTSIHALKTLREVGGAPAPATDRTDTSGAATRNSRCGESQLSQIPGFIVDVPARAGVL